MSLALDMGVNSRFWDIKNSSFCFKIYIETIFEVMDMLSKHNTIQHDQVQMIALDEISTSKSFGPKNKGSH